MKNKILALLLTFALAFNISVTSVFAAGMSIAPAQSNYEFEESQIGEKFVVDFMLDGNEGYNNSTFRIKYDPTVIKAVPNEDSDTDNDGFITYLYATGVDFRLFSNDKINTQLNLVPSSGQPDFEGRSDGKKTCAELGIVKLGQFVASVVDVYNITDNGIFLRMTFEIVGSGETDIEMLKAAGSDVIFYGINSQVLDVDVESAHVKVAGEKQETEESTSKVDETTESTTSKTDETTETTTKSSSSSGTSSSGGSSSNGGSSSGSSSSKNDDDEIETTTENDEEKADEDKTEEVEEKEDVTNSFDDIASYPWAEKAINYLASNKIVNGVGAGKFAPANNVKRADFLIMLMNALEIEANSDENAFKDVDANKYYAKAVSAAKSLGIASGDNEGNFRPEEFISRQDMMVLAYRALTATEHKVETLDKAALDKFADKASVSEYAKEGLSAMVSNKIVNGTGNNIEPKNNTTRAQAAVIIYNICEFIK